MTAPESALDALAAQLRAEDTVISAHVVDPGRAIPALGRLAAAGPRAANAPSEYALVVEAVREGYLLHYSAGRIVAGVDPDLALLAGDYLYALGLERLGGLGDLDAVRELSDLITLAAQVHDGATEGEPAESKALWLACVTAIAAGASAEHEEAKRAVQTRAADAERSLYQAASQAASSAGMGDDLGIASDSIDFRPSFPS
jgi:hypothetical protein